jgi:hypothetical protein
LTCAPVCKSTRSHTCGFAMTCAPVCKSTRSHTSGFASGCKENAHNPKRLGAEVQCYPNAQSGRVAQPWRGGWVAKMDVHVKACMDFDVASGCNNPSQRVMGNPHTPIMNRYVECEKQNCNSPSLSNKHAICVYMRVCECAYVCMCVCNRVSVLMCVCVNEQTV